MNKAEKIYVAGHRGLVGSAIVRALKARGYENFVYTTSQKLDHCNQAAVRDFYTKENRIMYL